MDNPEVGQLVYKTFSPVQAGKIVEVIGKEYYLDAHQNRQEFPSFWMVKVMWVKDKSITEVSTRGLEDFEGLIWNHQRKLDTHLRMKEKLDLL
jgi:hypothetical protein